MALKRFLDQGDEQFRTNNKHTAHVAFIDERSDDTGWKDYAGETHHAARDWDGYASYPPQGGNSSTRYVNAADMYGHLSKKYSELGVERRLVYLPDLTPTTALALVSGTAGARAPALRDFLQRYVTGRVFFGVSVSSGFALEFHLPYYALRRSPKLCVDSRGLRRLGLFTFPGVTSEGPDFLHEAQISVVITGVDEWFWMAYCCVDRFFGSEQDTTCYLQRWLDPFTGGEKDVRHPYWNPREYFLLILSYRSHQMAMEWCNLLDALDSQLIHHEKNIFNVDAQRLPLTDDPELNRTKEYSRIIELLHLLNNALTKVLQSWDAFVHGEICYLEPRSPDSLRERCEASTASIEKYMAELNFRNTILRQRIELFEGMRNGVSIARD